MSGGSASYITSALAVGTHDITAVYSGDSKFVSSVGGLTLEVKVAAPALVARTSGTQLSDVKRYLDEFLMDKRVIDYPYIARALLVKGIIVPFRVKKSAAAYKSIWTKDGSPLIVLSRALQYALQQEVEEPVALAMRYGNPSPEAAFDELMKRAPGLEEVIALPLYPHYAMSSYETAVEHAREPIPVEDASAR